MRRRSVTGPILLILLGAAFLIYNLRPDIQLFDLLSQYWPFLLIVWGSLRLVEVFVDYFRGTLQNASGFTGGEVVLIVFLCFIGWGARRESCPRCRLCPDREARDETPLGDRPDPANPARRRVPDL